MPSYAPYDDGTQLARQIPGYPRSFTRVPSQRLIARPLTLSELTGPSELAARLNAGPASLSGTLALGQRIRVFGRITDEEGAPLSGAVIEIWQANAAGKYVHELDRYDAPVDPNFTGTARLVTNSEGEYEFLSIKPGPYPVMESDWWWRPPHIHFSIFGPSWMNRFVTQIFFPGEPLNETDLLLNAVPDRDGRERLIFEPQSNAIDFRRDFTLRGKG